MNRNSEVEKRAALYTAIIGLNRHADTLEAEGELFVTSKTNAAVKRAYEDIYGKPAPNPLRLDR